MAEKKGREGEDGNREERVRRYKPSPDVTSSPSLPYSTPWFFLTAVAMVIGSTTNPRKELSGV